MMTILSPLALWMLMGVIFYRRLCLNRFGSIRKANFSRWGGVFVTWSWAEGT